MTLRDKTLLALGILSAALLVLVSACGNTSAGGQQVSTATPTPTELVAVEIATPTAIPSPCEGLSGELEIQVLVGPADAVGLTPDSVGRIPFQVVSDQPPYQIEGGGGFDYQDTLTKEWGTYAVTMEMMGNITGLCQATESPGELAIELEMSGSQLVVVTADGFSQEYPWEGTLPFSLNFPLAEGAAIEGEGYVIVLHLQ